MVNYRVISDKFNLKRRESISENFLKLGIDSIPPSIFVDAIMANRLTNEQVYSYAISDTYLKKGEIGCVLSHKKLYKEFLASNNKTVVIFEDDAVFSEEFSFELIKKLIIEINKMKGPVVLALQKSDFPKKEIVKVTELVSIYSCHKFYCTHGYIINREAAKNILKVQTPIRFEIDAFEYYYWLGLAELYSLNKDLVVQSCNLESTIGDERYNQSEKKENLKKKKAIYNKVYKKLSFIEKIKSKVKHISRILYQRRISLKKRFSFK